MPFCVENTAAQTASHVPHSNQPEDGSTAEPVNLPRRRSTAQATATARASTQTGSSQLI